MYYEIGKQIDLSYLNQPREVAPAPAHKSRFESVLKTTAGSFQEVGASYVWNAATGKLAKRITVQFA